MAPLSNLVLLTAFTSSAFASLVNHAAQDARPIEVPRSEVAGSLVPESVRDTFLTTEVLTETKGVSLVESSTWTEFAMNEIGATTADPTTKRQPPTSSQAHRSPSRQHPPKVNLEQHPSVITRHSIHHVTSKVTLPAVTLLPITITKTKFAPTITETVTNSNGGKQKGNLSPLTVTKARTTLTEPTTMTVTQQTTQRLTLPAVTVTEAETTVTVTNYVTQEVTLSPSTVTEILTEIRVNSDVTAVHDVTTVTSISIKVLTASPTGTTSRWETTTPPPAISYISTITIEPISVQPSPSTLLTNTGHPHPLSSVQPTESVARKYLKQKRAMPRREEALWADQFV